MKKMLSTCVQGNFPACAINLRNLFNHVSKYVYATEGNQHANENY